MRRIGDRLALEPDCNLADGMVLRREKLVHVWGMADFGQTLELEMQGQAASTVANTAGEAFVADGQSNMELRMRYDRDVESIPPPAQPHISLHCPLS